MKHFLNLLKAAIFSLIFISFCKHCFTQETFEYELGVLWVNVKDESAKLTSQNRTANTSLNNMFDDFNVTLYTQAMAYAKNPILRNIYEVQCNCDEGSLMDSLNMRFGDLFLYIEKIPKGKLLYDPEDYMWFLTTQDPTEWLWHLKKIQADLAWNITRGDPNLKIAVIDDGVDLSHPDLSTKIDPQYNFYNGNPLPNGWHGTSVTSFLAAETAESCTRYYINV